MTHLAASRTEREEEEKCRYKRQIWRVKKWPRKKRGRKTSMHLEDYKADISIRNIKEQVIHTYAQCLWNCHNTG